MSRLRRHLVPLLLMLPVIFICGKLLLTPVNVVEIPGMTADWRSTALTPRPEAKEYDRGWPWVFVHEYKKLQPFTSFASAEIQVREFLFGKLLANLALLIAMTIVAWHGISIMRRRSGGWLRFSLRGLIAFVTLVAIACGWWMHHERQFGHQVKTIDELRLKGHIVGGESDYFGPKWIRRFTSDEQLRLFRRITELEVQIRRNYDNPNELPVKLLNDLAQFAHLRKLSIGMTSQDNLNEDQWRVTNQVVRRFAELPNLQMLHLKGNWGLSKETMQFLVRNVPSVTVN
jgi:hypothetical protein